MTGTHPNALHGWWGPVASLLVMDGTMDDDDDSVENMAVEPPEHFDTRADDRDAAFVASRLPVGRALITDGTLSCPCCFSVVCYECQRFVNGTHLPSWCHVH